jgi:hypothetical protein
VLVYVSFFVSVQAAPNCRPNLPVEHDSVNLVVILATHGVALIPTRVRVVFVSDPSPVFAFLVQALMNRQAVVRSGPHEQLTPVRVAPMDIWGHSELAEMDEDYVW